MKTQNPYAPALGARLTHTQTHTHTHTHTKFFTLSVCLLMALFWLGSAQKANAQITVVNYSDCKFTLTISCPGGGSATSNNYADGWAGRWDGPAGVKVFNVACCASPTITLTFDPSYGSGAKGFANQQASSVNGKTYGCYGTGCNPVNGAFVINWDAASCTLTLSKPAGCN